MIFRKKTLGLTLAQLKGPSGNSRDTALKRNFSLFLLFLVRRPVSSGQHLRAWCIEPRDRFQD